MKRVSDATITVGEASKPTGIIIILLMTWWPDNELSLLHFQILSRLASQLPTILSQSLSYTFNWKSLLLDSQRIQLLKFTYYCIQEMGQPQVSDVNSQPVLLCHSTASAIVK